MWTGGRDYVHTHLVKEMQELLDLDADAVIPKAFETSIDIFSLLLRAYFVPEDETTCFIEEIHSHGYRILREIKPASGHLQNFGTGQTGNFFTAVGSQRSLGR